MVLSFFCLICFRLTAPALFTQVVSPRIVALPAQTLHLFVISQQTFTVEQPIAPYFLRPAAPLTG